MGGAQTLNIGFPHLDKFAYIGVFSSGVFGIGRWSGRQPPRAPAGRSNTRPPGQPGLKKG